MNSLFLYYYYSYICIKLNTVLMKDIQKEITPISSDEFIHRFKSSQCKNLIIRYIITPTMKLIL